MTTWRSASRGLALGLALAQFAATGAEVELRRVPGGGVQPQIVAAADGGMHLVFLRGEARATDVWHARRPRGAASFSEPVRVNSQPGSALAVGTIRGAQLALTDQGLPMVTWNGSVDGEGHEGAALFFAAGRPDGTFSTQQDVIRRTRALDGGGSVAVGAGGQVSVVWHGMMPGQDGETNRGVFLAESKDGGRTFSEERQIDNRHEGACGCCGLKTAGAADGSLAVLYRTATESVERDMALLIRRPGLAEPRRFLLDRWSIRSCPMSSATLSWLGDRLLAGWETREEVFAALVDAGTGEITRFDPLPGVGRRKHPSLAVGPKGDWLMAWVEGTGWNRGGAVAWQEYDRNLRPTEVRGRKEGVPVWGSAVAYWTGTSWGVMY